MTKSPSKDPSIENPLQIPCALDLYLEVFEAEIIAWATDEVLDLLHDFAVKASNIWIEDLAHGKERIKFRPVVDPLLIAASIEAFAKKKNWRCAVTIKQQAETRSKLLATIAGMAADKTTEEFSCD
jgi:hypothetical protein